MSEEKELPPQALLEGLRADRREVERCLAQQVSSAPGYLSLEGMFNRVEESDGPKEPMAKLLFFTRHLMACSEALNRRAAMLNARDHDASGARMADRRMALAQSLGAGRVTEEILAALDGYCEAAAEERAAARKSLSEAVEGWANGTPPAEKSNETRLAMAMEAIYAMECEFGPMSAAKARKGPKPF